MGIVASLWYRYIRELYNDFMLYKPRKSLGQNFLLNSEISSYMVGLLDLTNHDTVVEVGPGLGALTQKLSENLFEYGSKIYAVEIDSRFIPKLKEMFKETINVFVVEADILKWLPAQKFYIDFKVLGSLPYYITSPILHCLVKLERRPIQAVLLIQKEVAEKISAPEGEASYLSTFLQTFYNIEYLRTVPSNVFKPIPKVEGAIISFVRKEVPKIYEDLKVVEKYEKFLHKGFRSPRKMLNKPFKKTDLERVGVDGTKRPQTLNVQTWMRMFEILALNK